MFPTENLVLIGHFYLSHPAHLSLFNIRNKNWWIVIILYWKIQVKSKATSMPKFHVVIVYKGHRVKSHEFWTSTYCDSPRRRSSWYPEPFRTLQCTKFLMLVQSICHEVTTSVINEAFNVSGNRDTGKMYCRYPVWISSRLSAVSNWVFYMYSFFLFGFCGNSSIMPLNRSQSPTWSLWRYGT